LFKQGRSGEALALLRPVLQRRDGVDAEAAALAAACLGADGKYEEAARIDRMLCDAQPGNAQGWQSLGYDLFQAGDLPGALEAYAHAIELEPTRASTHYNLARIAMRLGEKGQAIDHFLRAMEIQPDFIERLDEDPDLKPLKDDPELQDRLPGRGPAQDPYADYYATRP
jgi:tetratricopeptide (TPR) repeat protein